MTRHEQEQQQAHWFGAASIYSSRLKPGQGWYVVLANVQEFYRRPRTKKRRIQVKWRGNLDNYRPRLIPIVSEELMGRFTHLRASAGIQLVPPGKTAWDWKTRPAGHPLRHVTMHPVVWERAKREYPEFASRATAFREEYPEDGGIVDIYHEVDQYADSAFTGSTSPALHA